MTEFTRRVVTVIRSIPRGRVLSYGGVAAAAGSPRSARAVAWILHSSSRAQRLPWHRVVGRDGRISLSPEAGGNLQRARLSAEGVTFDREGRLDMRRFSYKGDNRARNRRSRPD